MDSDRHSGRVRLLPPTLETTMQTVADRSEAPIAISRSTWLITLLAPDSGEKMPGIAVSSIRAMVLLRVTSSAGRIRTVIGTKISTTALASISRSIERYTFLSYLSAASEVAAADRING